MFKTVFQANVLAFKAIVYGFFGTKSIALMKMCDYTYDTAFLQATSWASLLRGENNLNNSEKQLQTIVVLLYFPVYVINLY